MSTAKAMMSPTIHGPNTNANTVNGITMAAKKTNSTMTTMNGLPRYFMYVGMLLRMELKTRMFSRKERLRLLTGTSSAGEC